MNNTKRTRKGQDQTKHRLQAYSPQENEQRFECGLVSLLSSFSQLSILPQHLSLFPCLSVQYDLAAEHSFVKSKISSRERQLFLCSSSAADQTPVCCRPARNWCLPTDAQVAKVNCLFNASNCASIFKTTHLAD